MLGQGPWPKLPHVRSVYELDLRAADGQKGGAKLAMAWLVTALAGLTAFGGVAADAIMWLPYV